MEPVYFSLGIGNHLLECLSFLGIVLKGDFTGFGK